MHRLIVPWATVCVGVAMAFALQSRSARAQEPQEPQRARPEVRKLTLSGVKHVDEHDLLKSISTQATKCRSLILFPICLFSRAPLWQERYYLDETELQRDVIRIRLYYWKRGYRETTVDTSVAYTAPRQVHVTFAVTEGEPTRVRKISITYDSTVLSDRVRNRLTLLHANDPLDLVLLDSMRVMFQDALWDDGYGDATVDTNVVVDSTVRLADVRLTLMQNRRTTIGTVSITGTQRVSQATVMNSLTFKTGDLYRQADILDSQRNLYESGLFRLAAIEVPIQYDSIKNVNIDVTEAPMHDARVGPGFDNVDFLQVQGHYTSYNLFGGARRLDIDATVGNLLARQLEGHGVFRNVQADVPDSLLGPFLEPTYNASVDFKQPSFLRRPSNAAAVGGFTHRTLNPGVFIDQGYGGQGTFTHTLAPRIPISLTYRYEQNQVQASDVYFCVNFGVCDEPTIASLRAHRSLSPLTLTGFIDRSDAPFSPTKGYVARLDFETANQWTLSDYRYNRAFFDGALYTHRSGTKDVFSAHLRVGFVKALGGGPDSGVLHPRKRFYAGGANSVRGYDENELGPRVLTIDGPTLVSGATSAGGGTCALTAQAIQFCNPNSPKLSNSDFIPQPLGGTTLVEGSVEYRMPLPLGLTFRNFVGAVFLDAGLLTHADIRGIQTIGGIVKGTGAVTPGFGVRYMSAVGPIRVDIGINPNRTENLAVVTSVLENGKVVVVPLTLTRSFNQGPTLLDRFVLHFSIGEAY